MRYLSRLFLLSAILWPACELPTQFVSNNNEVSEHLTDTDSYIFITEQPPEIIGGMEAIYARIIYPKAAIEAKIEDRVVIQFTIDEAGEVVNPKAIHNIFNSEPLGYGLEEAAIAAIMATRFTIGRQRGIPVPVRMSIPINFKLP